ncbi:MAG: 50S ribosomal protein L10 [Candidatus Thermoplasmatota archaeon]|nr:50S ribosomal protein L10 [Candidatus Thermoplasmatota archaeon]
MAHTREWKEKNLAMLSSTIRNSPVVGIASIRGLPASQFQQIRKKLYGVAEIHVSRGTLLKRAIELASGDRNGLKALEDEISNDQTAIISSKENPFKLFRTLEKNKTPLAAKGGEIAPADIEVKAGETSFKPGPVVGELQRAGIPAAIESGKVVIKKDKLLVKAGDPIPPAIASALTKLEIYPLVAGLDVKALFEGGLIFRKDVLKVDDQRTIQDIASASSKAFAVALKARYFTDTTVRFLLSDAHTKAVGLSISAGIPTKETVRLLISRAASEAAALNDRTKNA